MMPRAISYSLRATAALPHHAPPPPPPHPPAPLPLPLQVTRLHSFAFPLAEVAVALMVACPDFVPLLVGRLHQVSEGGCRLYRLERGWRQGVGCERGW